MSTSDHCWCNCRAESSSSNGLKKLVDKKLLQNQKIEDQNPDDEFYLFSSKSIRKQSSFDPRFFILFFLALLTTVSSRAKALPADQYRRELSLLSQYLGLVPANEQGQLPVNEKSMEKYIEQASDLNCYLHGNCLWANAPSDGLLDTTDFYLFKKSDGKMFPITIGPGMNSPNIGTNFAFAGNFTNSSQSAVLISAPIACQSSAGALSFDYWLYNSARIEVVLLKVNPVRKHLQVIDRPPNDCTNLKPAGQPCRIKIKRMLQPFRLAIRAHKLNNKSFVMLNNIAYEAELCGFYDRPLLFEGIPTAKWMTIRQRRPIEHTSELNCLGNANHSKCLWSDFGRVPNSPTAHWAIGQNLMKWKSVMKVESVPNGRFFFQHVDPMAELPLPTLQSALVPCTQTSSALSFRFWMTSGVQAQLCTVAIDHMPLSCVFLNEADAPGPITVDLDTADHQPFRFAFSIIRFDRANGGVLVVDDLRYSGYLCHEQFPTPPPRVIEMADVFSIVPFEKAPANYFSQTLDCDFESSDCFHWTANAEEDEATTGGATPPLSAQSFRFKRGVIPEPSSLPFQIDSRFSGNAAVAVFDPSSTEQQFAILTSQPIPCANRSKLVVMYFIGGPASLSVCANDRCVSPKRNFGEIIRVLAEKNVSSTPTPFFFTADNERIEQPFVIIKRIQAKTPFCRLETPNELACKAITCSFAEKGLCGYKTVFLAPTDVLFEHQPNKGVTAKFSLGKHRAILRSRNFRLLNPVEIRFEATLSTFGTRLHICPDENQQRSLPRGKTEIANCQLLLGPKVDLTKSEHVSIELDPELRHFIFVATNDMVEQFGEGEITISKMQVVDSGTGELLC